jgi:hypothetical protein
MLKYGPQALHKSELFLPSRFEDRPPEAALDRRYRSFIN